MCEIHEKPRGYQASSLVQLQPPGSSPHSLGATIFGAKFVHMPFGGQILFQTIVYVPLAGLS